MDQAACLMLIDHDENTIHHDDFDFDCSLISEAVDENTADLIVKIGNKYINGLDIQTARQHFRAIKIFTTEFLPNAIGRAALNLLNGNILHYPKPSLIAKRVEFGSLLSQFDTWLRREFKTRSYSLRNKFRTGLHWWLKKLATEGYVSNKLGIKLEAKKGDSPTGKGSTSKTLMDFDLPKQIKSELQDLVRQSSGDDYDWQEAELLYRHIAHDLDMKYSDIKGDDLPELVAQVLSDRLDVIRKHAETVFQEAKNKREEGMRRMKEGRKHLQLMCDFMEWTKDAGRGKQNPHYADIEKLSANDFDNASLAWFWDHNGGIYWRHNYHDVNKYNRWIKARNAVGSTLDAEEAQKLIGCSTEMTVSAQIIMVHDYTANVSSVRELTIYDEFDTIGGLRGVLAYKRRAGRILTLLDSIEADLTKASDVLRIVKSATKRYREHCIPKDKYKLFLLNYQNSVQAKSRKSGDEGADSNPISRPSNTWFNQHAKRLIKAASNTGWAGTTKSIRHSILLYDALTGGVLAVQEDAQHKDTSTSTAYSNRLAKRIQLDVEIRKFLRWMQTLVALNVDGFAAKLNLDEEAFNKQKEQILSSHFGGMHCKNPREGVQPNTKKGEVCGEISNCMFCENREHMFVVSEANLTHLLWWNKALINAYEKGFISEDPEIEWKMWGVFIREILAKVEGNVAFKAMLAGALEKAEESNPYEQYFDIKQVRVAS